MSPSKKPADVSKETKSKEAKPKFDDDSEDYVVKSPANIFLINKTLNPMFGVPQEKSHEPFLQAPVNERNINTELQKNINDEPLKNIESKEKKPKLKRSVRSTGLMGGGFNFVKDAMKSKKGKN